ncbi:glyoxalase/bleomycin resistance/extradiol dioxygenase family protein [Pseudooceanicola sediminis]|uniref:Glyoxalase/bleomycin resistance/extradiol dioxygenase family protein n=1 Tax=Pseudooceanicola sediminis TaxID=2211117 RepID=A0A399J348_9RHOB|nr:VOC family protein [Pseudooceanicola sediminis]KAA2317382.1 glyoxalase/bleomycin resistance/extradiol dioxygenase family protein [Puniceibacterium sp. HSS470]RII39735.1 glyoxalase/bleomycin resistance/extradiol dioxygenase family protein [Pseudooceanicola sediminis]|tara:strand:+ start:4429 stop:4869 length:441 start_codon:yes stop_codon:yes gene_type:complete
MTQPDTPAGPPPAALLEFAIYTADLDAAEAFYGGVLGLTRIVRADDRHVFYRVGDMVLLIFNPARTVLGGSNPDLPVPAHGAHGQGHLCFAATAAELTYWVDRLTSAGYPIEADFHWPGGARSIYLRDPAGNSLEFAEPRLWFPDA